MNWPSVTVPRQFFFAVFDVSQGVEQVLQEDEVIGGFPKPGGFQHFSGKNLIVSWTLPGMSLVCPFLRKGPRKRIFQK